MELNRDNVSLGSKRPVHILQFGEGNFLRAFVDWMVDIANEKGVINTDVAIVTPRFHLSKAASTLKQQQNLWHVILEGINDSRPERQTRIISCVAETLAPEISDDLRIYEQIMLSDQLRLVISNTTEAGIRYDETDNPLSATPKSFPGKVTNLLWQRFRHFNGAPDKGLIFLCCELIEDNSSTLKSIVEDIAKKHNLGERFISWVNDHCTFADSLVDRIVTGFPTENCDALKSELGFDDNAMVKGELYHLWVIGGSGWQTVAEEFPLHKAGLRVIFTPGIKEFRDTKVRILNGSHTAMVPIALPLGHQTVKEAFDNPVVNKFISRMVDEEVLPMIAGNPDELSEFASDILQRFYNPYIRHNLKSIALNSLSKWETRNFPTVLDNYCMADRLAQREIFTFAALLWLYSPLSGFEPDDNGRHIDIIRRGWDSSDFPATVKRIVGSEIFVNDFESLVPGFSALTAEYLEDIYKLGIAKAIERLV